MKVKRFLKGSNWSSGGKNSVSIIKHISDKSRLDASKEKSNKLEDKAIEKLITVRKRTRGKKKEIWDNTKWDRTVRQNQAV